LQRAEADQLAHRLGETGQHRAAEEDHDRRQEDGLAPDHVAELPVERRRDGRGEQVGGHHPGEVVEAAQVADDRWQRGRDDRLVERSQEHPQHQRCEHGVQSTPAQALVLAGAHECRFLDARANCARVSGDAGSGVAAPARNPSSSRPRYRRHNSGATLPVASITRSPVQNTSGRSSGAKSRRSAPCSWARSTSRRTSGRIRSRIASARLRPCARDASTSFSPRFAACNSSARSRKPVNPAQASSSSTACSACPTSSANASSSTASSRSSLVGKCRYSVPIPTPARCVISSTETSTPLRAKRARALATSRSRLRRASLRNSLGSYAGDVTGAKYDTEPERVLQSEHTLRLLLGSLRCSPSPAGAPTIAAPSSRSGSWCWSRSSAPGAPPARTTRTTSRSATPARNARPTC